MNNIFSIKLRIGCPYFSTFRKPTSTSTILTYFIPPYTTIRGLISNAMGLPRDDLRVQEWFKIGIKPLVANFEKSSEMAKILKLKGSSEEYRRNFSSSPMFKEFLVDWDYEVFLIGSDKRINDIYLSLLNPERMLYIGDSDAMVDIDISEPDFVVEVMTNEVCSVIEGFYDDCIIEKIPYKFIKTGKKINLEYKTISIPYKYPLLLERKVSVFKLKENRYIWAA
jgi:CRISPR-associated protein Cas5h